MSSLAVFIWALTSHPSILVLDPIKEIVIAGWLDPNQTYSHYTFTEGTPVQY